MIPLDTALQAARIDGVVSCIVLRVLLLLACRGKLARTELDENGALAIHNSQWAA
jgi:hypothetical protein